MGKTLIRVDCIDQRLYFAAAPAVASGGKNENAIEFSFCRLWDGFAKTAVFYRSEDTVYHVAIPDDRCIIPWEVLEDEGAMFFGVFGVKDDTTRTSEVARYRVSKGAITEGIEPSDPTPDIYTQILSQYADLSSRVSKLEASGGSGGGSGEAGAPGEDGGYYIPTVTADGTLTWTASKSDMPDVPRANIKGPNGDSGSVGLPGEDGVGIASVKQTTTSTADKGNNVVTVTLTDGTTSTFTVRNGSKGGSGSDGKDGADGTSVTVQSVSESSEDGGSNVVTFSDGKTVTIKNGSKGSTGATGGTGPAGSDGVGIKSVTQTTTSSADGGSNVVTVTKTDNTTSTFTIKNGSKGSTGATGATGPAGYTPVKGTDYWTQADQESIVQQVIAALGTPVFGSVDANNNIVLSGALVDGNYTIKYEAADGKTTTIGTLDIGGKPAYINVLDTVGWVENKRISASSGYAEKDNTGTDLTGYIAVKAGDIIRMKNVTMPQASTGYDNQLYYYNSGKTGKGSTSIKSPNYASVADDLGNIVQFKVDSGWTTDGTGFIRIGAANIDSNSIITINEVIE